MLTKVTDLLRNRVIIKYIHALSMNEIVRETPLSKGTVNNIIQDLRSKIEGIDIEEIRAFTYELRKSGITIEECAQGFRMVQLLKKFNIIDEFEVSVDNEDEYEEDWNPHLEKSNLISTQNPSARQTNEIDEAQQMGTKKKADIKNNHIIYFLEHIYKNCKRLGINPNIMTLWIEDLLSSFSDLEAKSDKGVEYGYANSPEINDNNEKKENERKLRREIPFVSRVSFYVKQKGKKIRHLEDIKNSISKDIDGLNKQRQEITSKLGKTLDLEKKVFSYFKWYENLKRELLDEHGLLIEQEFRAFANSIDDFKQYSFDVTKILTEYTQIDSLRNERESTQIQINEKTKERDKLKDEITSLEERGNYYRQTIETLTN